MDTDLDISIFLESRYKQIGERRTAGFQYEIVPEIMANEERKCSDCTTSDIMNAFCGLADFGSLFKIFLFKIEFQQQHSLSRDLVKKHK